MGSNRHVYYFPRRLAPIFTPINNTIFPNDRMHMAVNIEPSMRYFQIISIPFSAVHGPQKKELACIED
jgi:hypothetical protein